MRTHGPVFEDGGGFERSIQTQTVSIGAIAAAGTYYVQILPKGRAKQITRAWMYTTGAFSDHASTVDMETDDGSTPAAIVTQVDVQNMAANTLITFEVADGWVESDERVEAVITVATSGSLAVGLTITVEYAEAFQ